jgi:iron complex outermembrane receptor protein
VDSILGFASPGANYSNEYDTSSDTTSMAAFTQGEFAVNDKVTLLAGLRYSYEKKEIEVDTDSIVDLNPSYGLPAGTVDALVIRTTNQYTNDDSWDSWTPKVGVDYQFNDNAFLYGSITNGFKSGGFNGLATTKQQSFDPETVWAYEAGFKTDLLDKRLRINTGIFYYDYKDMQLVEYKMIDGNRTRIISNAGESNTYGGEIEISARPLPNMQLALGVAVLESEFDSYTGPDPDDSSIDKDFSGNELPYAPNVSANASVSYSIPCREWGYLTLYANYDWRDEVWTDPANQELLRRDELGLLNARISFDSADGKWQFQVYGDNITDEEYYEYKLRMNILEGANEDTVLGLQGDPATYGLRVRYNF